MSTSSPADRPSRYEPELIEQLKTSPWWWSMADNPPCVPWCTTDHDPYDFRLMGDLHCRRTIGLMGVAVGYYRVANEETPFQVDEGRPAWTIDVTANIEHLNAALAEQLARDLLEAAEFARREAAK